MSQGVRAPGTSGRPLKALTNAFELKWNSSPGANNVYHYDVLTPLWDLKNEEFLIGGKKGTEIIMRLQTSIEPGLFNPTGAYDGKKNLFSTQKYSFPAKDFHVPWDGTGRSQRPKMVSVKIVYVKEINLGLIQRLLRPNSNTQRLEGDAVMTLNMLNVFVQAAPRMTEPRIHNAKSFFTPGGKLPLNDTRPLEFWRGYYQSVRPTFDRIIVNIDVTIGVVVPAIPLEKLCAEYLKLRVSRDLCNLRQAQIQQLKQFVRGMKVHVDIAGKRKSKRPKTIRNIITNAGEYTFEKGASTTTVAAHFSAAHNFRIPPNSLGVELDHDGVFPISCCTTIEHLFKPRSSPEIVREALAFTPATPAARLDAIKVGWSQLQYQNSPFMIDSGMTVVQQPLQVHGRILQPPKINFGNERIEPRRPGTWDVVNKRLHMPAKIKSWTVVDFSGGNMGVISSFVTDLVTEMGKRGMDVGHPHNIVQRDGNADMEKTLTKEGSECRALFILVILPESAAPLYRRVKRYGDITQGVATQCVKWSSKLSRDAANGRTNQYLNNLILKINTKCGGVNYYPDSDAMKYLREVPTMIVGADVSHPGPGSALPSIAAMVSSYDIRACQYAASIRVQESRAEMITDLAMMFDIALHIFTKKNKETLPQRIFFFRDGVSEGEFATVVDKEIGAMKISIKKAYGSDMKMWPTLTFIVVGKRHHFRFFPGDKNDADPKGNGNLSAGFVVDRDITHPVYHDFYLQSQPGLKGTSTPSHYTVLVNGAKLATDQIEQIAYALCHCYTRATRSVKIPAPVYYADLVCQRAKFHFDDEISASEDMMSIRSGERPDISYYQSHFTIIHSIMGGTMYFV